MSNISKPTPDNIPLSPNKPIVETDSEMHDKDEFETQPRPTVFTTVNLVLRDDQRTVRDISVAIKVLRKLVQNFVAKAKDAGYESDWDGDIDSNEDSLDIEEGLSPLSHDNSIARKIRKHKTPRSRRHMDGSDRYRTPDPKGKILARIRRVSRHQPKPEIDEAYTFIVANMGKPIAESDIKKINNHALLVDAVEVLTAMALGGWEQCEDGITNGHYLVEGHEYKVVDNAILYKNAPLRLDWDWLYSTRQLLRAYNVVQTNVLIDKVKNG